ncbi:hypothetical protein [Moraxella lacunata]|uniref:hypothetical protein n=1 Tax=Moraxella lacunata TaxID=477 RepID=UPI003EE3421A
MSMSAWATCRAVSSVLSKRLAKSNNALSPSVSTAFLMARTCSVRLSWTVWVGRARAFCCSLGSRLFQSRVCMACLFCLGLFGRGKYAFLLINKC